MTREFICGQQTLLTCVGELVGFALLATIAFVVLVVCAISIAKTR